ncbi:hypothetical protein [Lignipirellula cremea]|uniref:Uncharacterized protein n=1 Tax=Lignipirellula cremea TaxID=2528010 RepID=A0A518DZC7_9BACT|nr:hypothetical protein [Lignipirellula cremea]QDU97196.1 hypothetical protein Pla8534_50410 [Lignipirellula cremea]
MNWLQCDDEMKMGSFIEQLQDEIALRRFALLNATSVSDLLVDSRSRAAVAAADAWLSGAISEEELKKAYLEAEIASDEIERAHDEYLSEHEERLENAALVALWAAYPVGYTGVTRLESAQDSALPTAFYCFKIYGSQALVDQLERLKSVGLKG